MMDLLAIGRTGVLSFQKALNATGDNVANADTPGFVRRKVTLATNPPGRGGPLERGPIAGAGVRVASLTRQYDGLKADAARVAAGDQSRLAARLDWLVRLESLATTADVAGRVGAFFNSATALAAAPTLAAARRGATVALANKECLVCAGALFLREIEAGGARLLPVDSEHSAIFQVLDARAAPERIILTASGGPFRDWPLERMACATVREAVAHPNWDMGAKISIDSATMFNKALEMIEARWLFDVAPHQVEVIVHPQSIVHSMVGYADGSVLAQLGPPDMRGAIGYALNWPDRAPLPLPRLDFAALGRLEFSAPDETRFPALRLARAALQAGGAAGCVLNGAKETALCAFIEGRIGFLDMARVVEGALEALSPTGDAADLDEVTGLDAAARRVALELCASRAA